MTESHPAAADDRTRDIMLPSLPGRPPPALPAEWAALRPPVDPPATAVAGPVAQPPAPPAAPSANGISREDAVARIEARSLAGQRTDKVQQPPSARRGDRTLSFSSPEMGNRPVGPVRVGRTARRWPWVVLTLLPIVVILGATAAWLVLVWTA